MVGNVNSLHHFSGGGCNAGRFWLSWGGGKKRGKVGGLEELLFKGGGRRWI